MSLSSTTAIIVLVCRAYSPDGVLLCETAQVELTPTTVEECQSAADNVRETWNQINDYAIWDAWAISCPADLSGLAVSKPAALLTGALEGN